MLVSLCFAAVDDQSGRASVVADPSVYDFVPSQSSPVKTKKSSRSAKPRHSKKPSKPHKKPSTEAECKKELIKQINQEWGIDETPRPDDVNPDPEPVINEGEPPLLSQATTLRNYINDIDDSVTLVVEQESSARKHCKFTLDSVDSSRELSTLQNSSNKLTPAGAKQQSTSLGKKGKQPIAATPPSSTSSVPSATQPYTLPSETIVIKEEIGADNESFSSIQVTRTQKQSDIRGFMAAPDDKALTSGGELTMR